MMTDNPNETPLTTPQDAAPEGLEHMLDLVRAPERARVTAFLLLLSGDASARLFALDRL